MQKRLFLKIELAGAGWDESIEQRVLSEIAGEIKVAIGKPSVGGLENIHISLTRQIDNIHCENTSFICSFSLKEKKCSKDHFAKDIFLACEECGKMH